VGHVVTFSQLPADRIGDGIDRAAITDGDTREMAAEFIRIEPGQRWSAAAPQGSDCYLFMLKGDGEILAGTNRHHFPPQTFATLQEGVEFVVENAGRTIAEVVKVLAPPQPNGRPLIGFAGTLAVAERNKTPVVRLPDQKKQRIYFVGDHGAKSERGHAMIVVYEKDTVTGLHNHPNAESMFVVLNGALQFTVDGEQVVVAPGQAANFGMNDSHGLRVANGHDGASFLEFHLPAAFTTVTR
jgi:mannose-6-phosphate isomerase-like protein (cupin superfamily)